MVRSQSGQVNFQKRKSSRTRSVFWIMKMSSSPSPVSEAIAPPPSRRASAGGLGLSLGLSPGQTLRSIQLLIDDQRIPVAQQLEALLRHRGKNAPAITSEL